MAGFNFFLNFVLVLALAKEAVSRWSAKVSGIAPPLLPLLDKLCAPHSRAKSICGDSKTRLKCQEHQARVLVRGVLLPRKARSTGAPAATLLNITQTLLGYFPPF